MACSVRFGSSNGVDGVCENEDCECSAGCSGESCDVILLLSDGFRQPRMNESVSVGSFRQQGMNESVFDSRE